MKEQFLDDIGLEELIGYIKKYVKDDQDVKPYASYSVFPKTGEQNIIYIDTTNNLTYYWDDTSKTYKALDVQTWDNLNGKPSTFPPSTHNHDDRYYTETEINTKLAGKANSSHTHKKADITDFPTSMPASDVKPWAKADTKPSYSKSEIGLGNVDNTADKDKSVKYATSAGAASSVDWSGVKNKPGTYPPSAHNHNIESLTNFDARVYDAAGTRAANTVLAAPSDSDGTARFRKLVAADLPSHTHNYAGSASAGGAANSSLSLYLNPSTRQTSGDYDMTSSTYACKVTHSVASTIMKTGRPPEDSSVLTFGWDTYAGWGAQLAIGSQKGNHLYVRGANSKQKTVDNKTVNYSEWDSNWRTILDSGNYSSYTVTKTGGGASGNWGINAASASKLTTNAGSSTQPIYFSNGVPVSCAYTLGKSVPSNAVFTDTNTWRPVENSLTSASTSNSLSAAQGKRLKNLIDEKTDIHNLNYGIKFSSSSMDSNGSQNTLYPAKYENGAYSKTTGVSTYANRNNTIHIGTPANMFGDICLAGGITSLGVYDVTTTTNLPISVTSQGYIRRYKSGSSLMIKNHIYKIGYDEAKELLNTNVYSFRYNDDGQPANGKEHAAVNRYGFVLEDMEKTFPMAVEYDENGLPAAWCVQIIVPTILEIVKHQQAEISSLKAENEELKEKISEIDNLKKSLDELRELITNK